MSRRYRGSGRRGGGGGRRRGPRGPLPPPPPRPERPAAATTAQPPRTRYFRRREFPGSPTPRPHSPPPLRAAPALTPGSAPPRRGRGGGEGGGCGYLRARPACSPELAPRPPGLERPPPSGAGALRELRAVPVGYWSESLIRTQHGGRVRGGFPRRRRLRGREEVALLARGERTHSAPSPSADLEAADLPAPGDGVRGAPSFPSAFLHSLCPVL